MIDDSVSGVDKSRDEDDEPQTDTTSTDVDDGRYIYCLIDTNSHISELPSDGDIQTDGIDGASPSIVNANGNVVDSTGRVGAVVHSCTHTYEAANLATVQRRILSHQRVVDAAGSVYDTPLPLRFNTVFEGGDEGVRTWIHDNYDQIDSALTTLAGTWEYRIGLVWDASQFESMVAETDEELQRIQNQRVTATEGTAFLLNKQYKRRLATLRNERRKELIEALQTCVEPLAVEMTEQGGRDIDVGGLSDRDIGEHDSDADTDALNQENTDNDDNDNNNDTDTDENGELIERVAVRVSADAETALGDQLDGFVERDGVSVTFTGPWPPYTFAPNIG